MTITVHGVLAGAYRGKDIGQRALLTHASDDGGRTALCKKVGTDNLADADPAVSEVTCSGCLRRMARIRHSNQGYIQDE